MSVARRRAWIAPEHPHLSVVRQCALLGISRSGFYYAPAGENEANLALMRLIDEQFLETPFYGARQMMRHLRRSGHGVGRARVRRLMRRMGLAAVYQKPRTSVPHPDHAVFPYLLRDVSIDRANQVWCADITYIPMRRGFLYLVAVMDWASRKMASLRAACGHAGRRTGSRTGRTNITGDALAGAAQQSHRAPTQRGRAGVRDRQMSDRPAAGALPGAAAQRHASGPDLHGAQSETMGSADAMKLSRSREVASKAHEIRSKPSGRRQQATFFPQSASMPPIHPVPQRSRIARGGVRCARPASRDASGWRPAGGVAPPDRARCGE